MTLRAVVGGGGNANNPMTSLGDMIIGGASGVEQRLPIGAANQVLTSPGPGSQPTWGNLTSGGVLVPINFSAILSGTQSLTGATWNKINLSATEFDNGGYYDTVNHRYLPTIAGIYNFIGIVSIGSNVELAPALYKNGTRFIEGEDGYSAANGICTGLISMNGTTDYVELWAFVSAGATAQATNTKFQGFLIH